MPRYVLDLEGLSDQLSASTVVQGLNDQLSASTVLQMLKDSLAKLHHVGEIAEVIRGEYETRHPQVCCESLQRAEGSNTRPFRKNIFGSMTVLSSNNNFFEGSTQVSRQFLDPLRFQRVMKDTKS